MDNKTTEITENDYHEIRQILDGKIPDNKLVKIIFDIKRYNDFLDHGESPYNRPTFAKVFILLAVIIGFIFWMVMPVYNMLLSSNEVEDRKAEIMKIRKTPTNTNFSFKIVLDTNPSGKQIIEMYDKKGDKLLGRGDLENASALVLSSNINGKPINTQELSIIKGTNVDLTEDIKEEVLDIIKKNYSVNKSYIPFESIDYGTDYIINLE